MTTSPESESVAAIDLSIDLTLATPTVRPIPYPTAPNPISTTRWTDAAAKVLEERYLIKDENKNVVETPDELCRRVAHGISQGSLPGIRRAIANRSERWEWRVGISRHDANILRNEEVEAERARVEELYYELLQSGDFLPNTPCLVNGGRDNGLALSACFVIPIEDDMTGIMDALRAQGIIQKTGGGTGMAFSRLRSKGARIKSTGQESTGPVGFMQMFNMTTEAIKQGGVRRGANMFILACNHPDIREFIASKLPTGILETEEPDDKGEMQTKRTVQYPLTNCNISVGITNEFMYALENGGSYPLRDPHTDATTEWVTAQEIWDLIVDCAWRTGDPGLFFIDRANESKANPIPDVERIEATNPCVTGDTLVYTTDGIFPIAQLAAENVAPHLVLSTKSNLGDLAGAGSVPFITALSRPVYRLQTNEGYEVRLTADHRVATEWGWVEAHNLVKGDKIHLLDRKGGFGTDGTEEEGRVIGWTIGDGTFADGRAKLMFFGDERTLAPRFADYVNEMVPDGNHDRKTYTIAPTNIEERNESRVSSSRLATVLDKRYGMTAATKLAIPPVTFAMSEGFQRGLLQGLFSADGSIQGNQTKGVSVRLTSASTSLLKDVQRLLLNFGIRSTIYEERKAAGTKDFGPERGGICNVQAVHELVIARANLTAFAREINFLVDEKCERLAATLSSYKRAINRDKAVATFRALVPEGEETVYDLTEPLSHSFVGNGIVLHNCGEQPLLPFDVCNLGSINLGRFVDIETNAFDWDRYRAVARMATRFLDDVIEVNPYPLPEITKRSEDLRRIGLGVMGFADALFLMGIPYGSDAARAFGEELMRVLNGEALVESMELARERGSFPMQGVSRYAGDFPRRNSNLTTVAPTGTIAILANCSNGIEPVYGLQSFHSVKIPDGKGGTKWRSLTIANEAFRHVAEREGFWSTDLEEHVKLTGSVQGRDDVPAEWQEVFMVAPEIAPYDHVMMQAAWQTYNDSGISKTVNMPNKATREEIAEIYMLAWMHGCMGTTIYRDGCKQFQVYTVGEANKDNDKKETIPMHDIPAFIINGVKCDASGRPLVECCDLGGGSCDGTCKFPPYGKNGPDEVVIRDGVSTSADDDTLARTVKQLRDIVRPLLLRYSISEQTALSMGMAGWDAFFKAKLAHERNELLLRDENDTLHREIEKLRQAPAPVIHERDAVLSGRSYMKKAPEGTIYTNIHRNAAGVPIEVFIEASRAGTSINTLGHAIGRLISLYLRTPSTMLPEEKLLKVADQLDALSSGSPVGFGPNRIGSLADAVAKSIFEDMDAAASVVRSRATFEESEEVPFEGEDEWLTDDELEARLLIDEIVKHERQNGEILNDIALLTKTGSFRTVTRDLCGQCGQPGLESSGGCSVCRVCGASKC